MKTSRATKMLFGGFCLILGSIVFFSMVVFSALTQTARAASSDYSITLKVSHGQAGTPKYNNKHGHATRFKEIVEKQTNGAVKVEIYPLGQLYSDKDSVLAVANGTIFGSVLGSDVMPFWEKSMYMFQMPGLFTTNEMLERFLDSEKGGKEIEKRLIKSGLFPAWHFAGRLVFFTTKKPITSLADAAGQKLRCNESEMNNKIIAALGASAVNMSSSEMYTAAQTGMIDGAYTIETAVTGRKMESIFRFCLDDPSPYYTPSCSVASVRILEKMPADIRKIVQDAWLLSAKQHGEIDQREQFDKAQKILRDAGVKFVSLDNRSKETVLKKWQELSKTFSAKYGITGLFNEAVRLQK